MEFLKKMFKDKDGKTIYNLLLMLTLGIVLLVAGSTLFSGTSGGGGGQEGLGGEPQKAVPATQYETALSYEQQIEKRLEDTLSLIEGAGKVKVMLTMNNGKEIVAAQNEEVSESVSDEKDNEGGSRNVTSKTQKDTFVMVRQKDGSETPLILKEIEPRIEGVAIVAEGGDNIAVKDALVRATYTVLGVPPHKVQIAKMKN